MKIIEKPTPFQLRQLQKIADYQFGKGAGEVIFKNKITIEKSRVTKRIRYIYLENKRIFSFRVRDGFLVPSLLGGEILYNNNFGYKVKVNEDAEPFIRKGKTVFAKHVIDSDEDIAIKDEVFIINQKDEFIGIGTAKLPGKMMKEMNVGVAVDTRKGKEIEN
ncbi:MAG: PUA domain-containing protein [Candidatus Heimdallarchaeaceae archaeon]